MILVSDEQSIEDLWYICSALDCATLVMIYFITLISDSIEAYVCAGGTYSFTISHITALTEKRFSNLSAKSTFSLHNRKRTFVSEKFCGMRICFVIVFPTAN